MIKASVQPTIYTDIIESMVSREQWSAPEGLFYLLNDVIVPYTPKPTILRIETDMIGYPINISSASEGPREPGIDIRDNKKTITVVANSEITTVGLQLNRGINTITVSVGEESTNLIVRATTIVTLWEAFARVLYNESLRVIEEQNQATSSQLATRLIEPFISFQDLLPDIQSLQILSTRLAARGLIHNVATKSGVTDIIKALSVSTPVYRPMEKDSDEIDLLDPWTNVASQYTGQEAHVWIPNAGIVNWVSFLHYVENQPDLFTILSISENEVVVEYQGEQQRHRFDFDSFGTDFLASLAREECFKSITITIRIDSYMEIVICAASYTFDLFITEDTPIGNCRFSLDKDIPLDIGCPLDSDPVDPFSDGWVGLSLSGRFEQDSPYTHTLDTFIQPSPAYAGAACGYEGFYTQMVVNHRYDIDVPVTIDAEGVIQSAIAWTLESPNGTKWDIKVDGVSGVMQTFSGSTRTPDDFKIEKPDTSEASFAITNAGVLIVVSPPPGGEILRDNIFLKASGGSVWDVQVTDLNIIETTKIFL